MRGTSARRVLAGLAALAVGVGLAVGVSATSHAADPVVRGEVASGPLTFTGDSEQPTVTAALTEDNGYILSDIEVYDPGCSIDPDTGRPVAGSGCPAAWLSNKNPQDNGEAGTNVWPLTGSIPNHAANGALVRGDVPLTIRAFYTAPGAASYFTGQVNLTALSGTRTSISGPEKVRPGGTLRLDVTAEIFGDGWAAFNGPVVVERQPNAGGGFFPADHVTTEDGAAESVNPGIEDSANWQSHIKKNDDRDGLYDESFSEAISVAVRGDEPPPPPPPVPAGKVPSAPVHTRAHAGNHKAVFTWKAPRHKHGKITKYRVHRFHARDRVVRAGKHRFVFKHLKNRATYTFYVQAHNKNGWGKFSRGVTARPHR